MIRLPGAMRLLLLAQGIFYFVTGLWPLLSMATFERVTGPKVDHWLVKTVGVLVAVIGVVFLMAAYRGAAPPEVALLAVGSAATLAGVDLVYVAQGRIRRVYLLDAAAEVGIVVLWIAFWLVRDR